jgi:hypothetical protein
MDCICICNVKNLFFWILHVLIMISCIASKGIIDSPWIMGIDGFANLISVYVCQLKYTTSVHFLKAFTHIQCWNI